MRFQFKIRTLLAACTFFAMYLSAYLGLREPIGIIERSVGGIGTGYHEPNFQYGGGFAKYVFLPATEIDKFCRPRYWRNYSTADDVWTSQDYSWGTINICNGRPWSLHIKADTETDFQDAFNALRADRRLTILRITGEGLMDTHLETLQRMRKFDSIRFIGTSVSQSAAMEYQRTSPETDFFGISNSGEKYSRPR
jgi:hypothetical protein